MHQTTNPMLPKNQISMALHPSYAMAAAESCGLLSKLMRGDIGAILEMLSTGVITAKQGSPLEVGGRLSAEGLQQAKVLLLAVAGALGNSEPNARAFTALPLASEKAGAAKVGSLLNKLFSEAASQAAGNSPKIEFAGDRLSVDTAGLPTVTLSWDEAQYLEKATEAYARLCMGQLEFFAELVAFDEVPVGLVSLGVDMQQLQDRVPAAMKSIKALLGHPGNGSFGIGNKAVSVSAHAAWELRKELQQKMALHLEPKPSFRCNRYDGNILRYTSLPLPVIQVLHAPLPTLSQMLESQHEELAGRAAVEARFLTFHCALGNLPERVELEDGYANLLPSYFDAAHEVLTKRWEELLAQYTALEPQMEYSTPLWEECEQFCDEEPLNGLWTAAFGFIVSSEFTMEHLHALKRLTVEVLAETGQNLGHEMGPVFAELSVRYTGLVSQFLE